MGNQYWSFVVKNCGVKINTWVMKKTLDILISMMFYFFNNAFIKTILLYQVKVSEKLIVQI